MKTRNGFVSNSSSSSFIIAFKDITVFDKFKDLEGYKTLISDLNIKTISNLKQEVYDLISGILYDIIYEAEQKAEGQDHIEHYYEGAESKWKNLKKFFNYSEKDTAKYISELNKECLMFTEKMQGRIYDHGGKDVCEFKHKAHEIVKRIYDIAEKFVESEQVKEYQLKCLEYEDYSVLGDYMSHEFMPLIEKYPCEDMLIVSQIKH